MRDLETISTALLAAETATWFFPPCTRSMPTETISAYYCGLPAAEQKQIRLQLAATLKAVVSQRLVRRADDKGRVPAVEIMIATGYIRDCIINADKTRLIHDAIGAGTSNTACKPSINHSSISTANSSSPSKKPCWRASTRTNSASHSGYSFRRRRRPRGNGHQMADFERFSRK